MALMTVAPPPMAATAMAAALRRFWSTSHDDTAVHNRMVAVAKRAKVVLPMP